MQDVVDRAIEKKFRDLEISVDKRINDTSNKLREELVQSIDTQLQAGQAGPSLDDVRLVIRKQLDEYDDVRARCERAKTNVIIHGIKESDSVNPEIRKNDDLEQVKSIFNKIDEDNQYAIKTQYRLGSKSENKERPLKVVLEGEEQRNRLVAKSRGAETGQCTLTRDRPKEERDKYKEKKQEYEVRIANGETNIAFRGGRIVPFRGDPRKGGQ